MSPTRHIALDHAGPTVDAVMLRAPRVWSPDERLAAVADELANPRVRLLLVCEGERFVGAVTRGRALDSRAGERLGQLADPAVPRAAPGQTPAQAVALMSEAGVDRLPVVDEDGVLRGLVCWNAGARVFCADPRESAATER